MSPSGLEATYLQNRERLLRLLLARGAGEAAEDLLQELWLKVSGRADGPIANPLAYLLRAADLLMIDRYRSRRQSDLRDKEWEASRHDDLASEQPRQEVEAQARQEIAIATTTLRALGARKEAIFRKVRIDGVAQRLVAEEFGISLSTVESDLREAARALARLREEIR